MDSERTEKLKKQLRDNLFCAAENLAQAGEIWLTALLESKPETNAPACQPEPQQPKEFLTKKEVAELLNISPRSVNDRMNEGLPFFKAGKITCFDRADVLDWAKNRNVRGRKQRLRLVS